MLLTHFIWQTDLKPLSGMNAKNGAIPPSLTPTMHIIHARCYKASEWVGGSFPVRNSFASYMRVEVLTISFSIQYSVMFIRGNGVTRRTQKVIQGDDNGHVGRPCEVSLAPP